MLTGLEQKKLNSLKLKIMKDLSQAISQDLILPYDCSKEEKVERGVYRIQIPVLRVNGKVYPQNLFCGYGFYNDSKVLFLPAEYAELGAIYRTAGSDWVYGIKESSSGAPNEVAEIIEFELDLKRNKYKILDERAGSMDGLASEQQKGG